jgi:DNA-directed RNA polymerase I subunit RPA2
VDDIILQFVARKQGFLIPAILILRSLSGLQSTAASEISNGMGITDEELYRRIVQGNDSNTFLKARAELLLQDARARYPNLNTPEECLSYIGSRFRRLSLRAHTRNASKRMK